MQALVREVRLEKPGQLDNMLTNRDRVPKTRLHAQRERMSMRKAFLALLLAASVTPAMAQEKNFELKMSHWVPASHPLQKALEDWGCGGREGKWRHRQVQGVSGAAARQGVRPLRHGARRHRRRHLHQSRLSARPFPDHRRRRTAVPDVGRQGRLDGARRLVPQICREGDEGRQVLPRLHPFAVARSTRA